MNSTKKKPSDHDLLNLAIMVATSAHSLQLDQQGLPYICHPLQVMLYVDDIKDKIVAVLHDVIEDTDYTEHDLLVAGFPYDLVQAVVALTKRLGELYFEYIRRLANNPRAVRVKLADLQHNLSRPRLRNEAKQTRNVLRYNYAVAYLNEVLARGVELGKVVAVATGETVTEAEIAA